MAPMAKVQCPSPRSVSGVDEEQQFEREERKPRDRKTVAFRLEEESSFDEDDNGVFGKVKCFYGPLRPELTPEENKALYYPKVRTHLMSLRWDGNFIRLTCHSC
jgi:hypothetical protein